MSNFALLISLFICLILRQSNADPNVTFAAVLFRHGDRTIISPYPNDPHKDSPLWDIGYGQLTDLGKQEQYELGQTFRERFKHLLSDDFRHNELYVRSTDFDRTIMSALSNLAGMYPVKPNEEFLSGLAWKPIPIHSIPLLSDQVLAMKARCDKYDYEYYQLINGPIYASMNLEYAELYKNLTLYTGKNISSIDHVNFLYDTLKIETMKNLTLPDWTNGLYPDTLEEIAKKSFLTETYTPSLARLKAGPLIKEIYQTLKFAESGHPLHKVILYSAHDTTLANILNAFGLFELHLPPYAAHLLIELLPDLNTVDKSVVRMTYQGEVLNIPQCGTLCPLSKWHELYSWIMPSCYECECSLTKTNKKG